MATPKSQRIAITIIAVVMVVGTLGSFAVMILSTKNSQLESQAQQDVYAQYQAEYEAYQVRMDAQAAELSKKYYPTFSKYKDLPTKFSIDSVTELGKEELKVGTGAKITDSTNFAAYYIGWNPEGKVFDQSIEGDSLKSPFTISGLKTTSVIQGWTDGLVGMKIGGVRLLSIPSDLAYGEAGSGDDIPPNTPIKFVVLAVAQPETIPAPEIPQSLLQQY